MAPLFSRSQTDLGASFLNIRRSTSSIAELAQRYSKHVLSDSDSIIEKRQSIVAIPTTYGDINSGPSPGTVVGIVLGSVAGFLFILWLLYTVFSFGSSRRAGASVATTEVVRERRRGKSSRKTHSGSRSRRVSETVERVEIRRPPSPRRAPPPPAPPPVERVIVEERREERRESRPPPQIRRVSSDEVVVIEEHSPPRRKSSRREREAGGYRTVDPLAYGGGGAPMREVSRHTRRSRS